MRAYTGLLHVTNWGPRLTRKGAMTPEGRLPGRTMRRASLSYLTMFVGGGAVLWGSMQLIPLLPTGFIPQGDESRFVLSVELPPARRWMTRWRPPKPCRSASAKNEHVRSVFILAVPRPRLFGAAPRCDLCGADPEIDRSLGRPRQSDHPGAQCGGL